VGSAALPGPASVPTRFAAVRHLELASEAPADAFRGMRLTFTLSKAQLAGKLPEEVAFLRWDGAAWKALPVKAVEDAAGVTFTGALAGFGFHAIVIDQGEALTVSSVASPAPSDRDAPVVEAVEPAAFSLVRAPRPLLRARFSDAAGVDPARVAVEVDGAPAQGAVVTAEGFTYAPLAVLADGLHAVRVTVVDVHGNHAVAAWSFTIDTAPPLIGALTPADGATARGASTLEVGFADALAGVGPAGVRILLDGQAIPARVEGFRAIADLPEGLAPGRHAAQAELTDLAGNTATAAWAFTLQGDAQAKTTPMPAWAALAALGAAVLLARRRHA
jgi:uncharacterized protein (TIGR03382 family)